MKALIQRVQRAEVRVDDRTVGQIGKGLLVFLGVGLEDTPQGSDELVEKIIHLRIFENPQGKFDRSVLDVGGEILVVSQFTLYADCSKGRRPSFTKAAPPSKAQELYDGFLNRLKAKGIPVASGLFGAKMEVHLVNDGPVTLMLETPISSGRGS